MSKNPLACHAFWITRYKKSKKTLPLSRNRHVKLTWNRKNPHRQKGFGPVSSSLGRCMLNIHIDYFLYIISIILDNVVHFQAAARTCRCVLIAKSMTGRGVLQHTRLALDFCECANRCYVFVCMFEVHVCMFKIHDRQRVFEHTYMLKRHTYMLKSFLF